jgi:hypothetical protein
MSHLILLSSYNQKIQLTSTYEEEQSSKSVNYFCPIGIID